MLGPLPVFLVVGAVAVGAAIYSKRVHRKRVEAATALAAAHGFHLDAEPKPPPLQEFDLFERGHSRTVSFQFWRPGRQDSVFAYRYTTGSGKNRTTHHHTCALVSLPFTAPHTKIGPEGFWSGIGQALGIRDIEVEAPRFNERYKVDSDDERFAVTMLDGRAIEWFMRDEGGRRMRFEFWGPWLLVVTDRMEIDRYLGFHDWAIDIPAHLPDVLPSLYPVVR